MKRGIVLAIGAVVVLIVGGFGFYQWRLHSEAAKWSGPMKEIAEEEIKHDNDITRSRFVAIIDAPIDKVQVVVWRVEDLQQIVSNFKISKLIDSNGNSKRMEIGIQAL